MVACKGKVREVHKPGSRVCADPDCADCAAEFECVACMGGDGEGSCEDEGGVLV